MTRDTMTPEQLADVMETWAAQLRDEGGEDIDRSDFSLSLMGAVYTLGVNVGVALEAKAHEAQMAALRKALSAMTDTHAQAQATLGMEGTDETRQA